MRLDSKGALVLRKGRRKLRLASPQVKLARKGSITAKVGKRRVTLFSVSPAKGKAMRINTATGRATLAVGQGDHAQAAAGRRIRRALKLRRTPSGGFGTVTVIATIKGAGGGTAGWPGAGCPGSRSAAARVLAAAARPRST